MERRMVLISLAGLKIKWPRLHFREKPVNIHKILALYEAEKRMDEMRIVLDEIMRNSRLR
jgi:hypothetical protein